MKVVSTREFRANQASFFDMADAGEKIVIRRRSNRAYMLIPIEEEEFTLSPAALERIEKSRKDVEEGRYVAFDNAAEAQAFLENL